MAERHYYFAYGSNMNPDRVRKREMPFEEYHPGVLDGYRLVFNKRNERHPGAASANVVEAPNDWVEGVLYRLPAPEGIHAMDPFEGYPVRYDRQRLPVWHGDIICHAWVYLANEEFVADGLKPARWYLEHLLKGQPHLTEDYYRRLIGTECLPDSDLEP